MASLRPHLNGIRSLQGCVSTANEVSSYGSNMLDRREQLWSCMPNLAALVWEIDSCSFHKWRLHGSGLQPGLPASLQTIDLTISWQQAKDEEGDIVPFKMQQLVPMGYHKKLRDLTFTANGVNFGEPAVINFHLTSGGFPLLRSFTCEGSGFIGTLMAPALTSVTLESKTNEAVDWSCFRDCHQLETVHVTNGVLFDCQGCTFPDTLRHLCLSVAQIKEDGAFSHAAIGLQKLETMHVSFYILGSEFSLRSFRCSKEQIDIDLNQGFESGLLGIWMPPEGDDVWHSDRISQGTF